jgi:hypothetical protein
MKISFSLVCNVTVIQPVMLQTAALALLSKRAVSNQQ